MIRSLAEVEAYLEPLYAKAYELTGLDITLDRTLQLLHKVGNPHEKLRVVHVAGTSGKTSTSYYIAEMLHTSGRSVGLTVSPHISSLTERLQINGKPLADDTFLNYFNAFLGFMDAEPDATYFEFLITFVLWVFHEEQLDYAVLETGLGGLHDSTNVTHRPDKVCVITDIGFDHEHILGNTLSKITTQKLGIVHESNHVFMYRQDNEIMDVVQQRVAHQNASLHIVAPHTHHPKDDMPLYQVRNWTLAREVVDYISKRDDFVFNAETAKKASHIQVPGRMHTATKNSTTFVLDGAHNVQKMTVFVQSFIQRYGEVKVPVILAIKSGKDYEQVIEILRPIMKKAYCVGFTKNQDFKHTSVSPTTIAQVCTKHGIDAEVYESLSESISVISHKKEPVAILTGSLYLLGDAIKQLH